MRESGRRVHAVQAVAFGRHNAPRVRQAVATAVFWSFRWNFAQTAAQPRAAHKVLSTAPMDLGGARVLLVAEAPAMLDRVGSYLSKAGARALVALRTSGLVAVADRCDVIVLFDDYGEPEDFNVFLEILCRSRTPLLIVTERDLTRHAVQAEILPAPSRLVRGWSLLHAIRTKVRPDTQAALVESTPELPFTD